MKNSIFLILLTICLLSLSHAICLYVFDLMFLKIIPKMFIMEVFSAKYRLFFIILKQNSWPFPALRLSLNCYLFVHVLYAIFINIVFHSVNLTLHTVTSMHNIEKWTKNSCKFRSRMEAVQEHQEVKMDDSSFKRERNRFD